MPRRGTARLQYKAGVTSSAPSPPAFSPLSLSPALWLDATTGITLNGSYVSGWADQSGNGRNVTAATNKQPLYSAAAVNGLAGLTFDGVDDRMTGAAPLLAGDTDFTMYAVVKKLAASGTGGTAYFSIGTDKSYGLSIGSTSSNATKPGYLNGGVAWQVEAPDLANNSVVWQELRRTGGGTNNYLRSGGATLSSSTAPVAAPYGNFSIGSHSGSGTSFQNMIVCELVFFTSVLSAGNRTLMQTYLATRWGDLMGDVIVVQYVPGAKRQAYASAMAATDKKEATLDNMSIEFESVPDGPSDLWNTVKGYDGTWFGASQGYPLDFAQKLLTEAAGTEAWFVAVTPDGEVVMENLTENGLEIPKPVTFLAVAEAVGLTPKAKKQP